MYVDVLNSYVASLHPLLTLLVIETLTRLCKHTCSPEPSLITSVISTSRVFTSSYGAPRKLISCSGPSCVQEKNDRSALLGHIAELGNPLKCLKGRGGLGVSVG